MSKTPFLELFSDSAATPRPEFIAELKSSFIKAASPPSTGWQALSMTKKLLLVATTTTLIAIGGVSGRAALQNNAPAPSVTETTQEEITADKRPETPEETLIEDDNKDNETTVAEQESQETEEQSDSSQPAENDPEPTFTVPDINPPVNTDYTIAFWNLTPGGKPIIQDRAADYYLTSPNINFDWGPNSPSTDVIFEDDFVFRAIKQQTLEQGNWQITWQADEGVRVYVDGELVLDRWVSGASSGSETFTITEKIQEAEIIVDYYEKTDEATINVTIEQLLT